MSKKERNQILGHGAESDGIEEYDNPMPNWWVGLFYLTIIWAAGYVAYYHFIAKKSYVKALAAPFTVDTIPEATLLAFADHGDVGAAAPADGGNCEPVLAEFAKAGVDIDTLAARLQDEGAEAFVKSWNELMGVIAAKSVALGNPA